MRVDLTVAGEPRGKARPRFVRATGRAYTDKPTTDAEERIRLAWLAAGGVSLPDGPLVLHLIAVMERPAAHWKKSGELSAAGERSKWPTKKPDLDNLEKLVGDALQGHAMRDDSAIVHNVSWKRWTNAQEEPHLRIRLLPLILDC